MQVSTATTHVAEKPVTIGLRSNLQRAIDYALASLGSGFRNDLCRSSGEAMGLDPVSVKDLAAAVENYHLASLLLDDLPCMDDALERRGRLATHVVYGESRAILSALALINRAYIGCWSTSCRFPQTALPASRVVNRLMGENGILEGQDRDLNFQSQHGSGEVLTIARLKTGSLLELSLILPAVLGGAGFGEVLRLKRLSRDWGKAYQALDDFKDLMVVVEATGKTPFQDKNHNRPNLVHSMGPERALWKLVTLLESAGRQIDGLEEINPKWRFLGRFHNALTTQRDFLLNLSQTTA